MQQGVGGGGACSAAGGGGWPAVLMPRLLLAAGGPPAPSRGAPARLLSAGRGAGRAGLAQMPAGSGLCEGIACSLWTCLCGPWHSSLCFSLVVGVREREGGARCPSRYWWPRASRLSAPRQSVTRPLPLPAVAWLCERCLSRVAGGVSSLAGEWHRSVSLWPSGLGCPGWGEQQQTGDKCSEPGDRVPWTLQRLPQPRAPPACAQAQPSRPPLRVCLCSAAARLSRGRHTWSGAPAWMWTWTWLSWSWGERPPCGRRRSQQVVGVVLGSFEATWALVGVALVGVALVGGLAGCGLSH